MMMQQNQFYLYLNITYTLKINFLKKPIIIKGETTDFLEDWSPGLLVSI